MAGRVAGKKAHPSRDDSQQRDHSPFQMSASGLLAGTDVLTLDGALAVEHICVGDRVVTRDTGMAKVTAVEALSVTTEAIWIAAGSLGHTRPDQDITLPAAQAVFLRDWRAQALYGQAQASVRAERLVDGEFIKSLGRQKMKLYRLIFETPHILYAGGLELVSHAKVFSR